MSFVYYPAEVSTSSIDYTKLRHKYFVQLQPDGQHLVLGMLQQGERPASGHWLEISKMDRTLPERYFVMYTNFNTLVPGSLITGTQQPQGKWKELKVKKNHLPFYRVYTTEPLFTYNLSGLPGYQSDNFVGLLFSAPEIYYAVHAEYPPGSFRFKVYYFFGSFNELNYDIDKLTLINTPGAYMQVIDIGNSNHYVDIFDSNVPDTFWLGVQGTTPPGNYALIMGLLDNEDEVTEYIVIENALQAMVL